MISTKSLVTLTILFISIGFSFLWAKAPLNTKPNPSPASQTLGINESSSSGVLVTKVVDGDTIEIETGEKIRIIGVDTPETVDPKRPDGCFGKEASNELKRLLTNKRVILERDIQDKDRYGRLLRYVYLPSDSGEMLFIDEYLIRSGFGKVLTIPPDVKYTDKFTEAQTYARENKLGLWGSC